MKKLLIFMLVLGLASVSQAVTVDFAVDGSTEYSAIAGETITVDLIADLQSTAFGIGAVAEALAVNADGQATVVTDMGGLVGSAVMTAPTGTLSSPGYQDNYNGLLFDVASWYGDVAGGVVIASFSYTIASDWDGTTDYYVAPLAEGTAYYYMEGQSAPASLSCATLVVDSTQTDVEIGGLHIVPEPMTVLLLGLGGLFLRRRKG